MSGAKDPSSKSTDRLANEFKPPLKPRPLLAVVLGILLALWLVALVVMRLKTVHPATAPGAPAAPSGTESPK